MEQIIARVKKILLSPEDALSEVKSEAMSIVDTMKDYVAIVAAVPAVAMLFGMLGRVSFFRAILYCFSYYAVCLVNVFLFGKIIDALAPHFNSTKDEVSSFKLSMYSLTPAFIAGIFNFNPSLYFLSLLGAVYGFYVFYLGLPILMETPAEKKVIYTVASIVIMSIVTFVLISIVGALTWGGMAISY